MKNRRPVVGIGVIILKGKEVLMQKRLGRHGQNTWSFPGGHLEYGESFEQAAERETWEECGLRIYDSRFVYATNDIHKKEGRHHITVYMKVERFSGRPKAKEKGLSANWQWVRWGRWPKPLFLPIANLLKSGYNPFK
jgi:8-oxo-dGTP diphosphatase